MQNYLSTNDLFLLLNIKKYETYNPLGNNIYLKKNALG